MNTNFKNLDVIQNSTKRDTNTINVKDFGAKGDGNNDDTNAIQNAINYAISNNIKHVFFPDGKYKVSSGFKFNTSSEIDLVIEGNGWNSIIQADQSLQTPIDAIFEITSDAAKRFELKNLAINMGTGQDTNKWKMNYGFKYSGNNTAAQIRIRNVRIQGALKYAIDLGKAEDSYVQNCQIVENNRGIRFNTIAGSATLERTTILQSHEYDIVIVNTKQIKITDIECASTVRQAKANIIISGPLTESVEIKSAWLENKKGTSTNEGYNIWISNTNPDDNTTGQMPNSFMVTFNGMLMTDTDCIHIDENTGKRVYLYIPHVHIGRLGGQTAPARFINIDGNGIHNESLFVLGIIDYIEVNNQAILVNPYTAFGKYHIRRLGRDSSIRVGKNKNEAEFGAWIPNTKTEGIEEALAFAETLISAEPNSSNKAVVEILDGIYTFGDSYKLIKLLSKNSRVRIKGQGERTTIIEGHIDDYMLEFKTSDPSNSDYGYLEIKDLTIINRGANAGGTSNVNGLHTFHINTIKLDKVWIGGKLANINTDQLQAEGEAPANSIGLFIEGQGAEQVTTIDTLVSGFDIAYKINADHIVMINPQARKIGSTMFWFERGFDWTIINPHGFQIGQRDPNISGMFYFAQRPRNVTAINVHHEDRASWQTAQAPLINLSMDIIDFEIFNAYLSVTNNEDAVIIKTVSEKWVNGIKIHNLRIDESATNVHIIQKGSTPFLTKTNIHTLDLKTLGYGSNKYHHDFYGDARLFGTIPYKVIYETPNTSNTISNTETTYYNKTILGTYYGKFNAVIQLELKSLAPLPIDQDITIKVKYAGSVIESKVIRPLQQTNAILPITIDTEFSANTLNSIFEITAVASNSDTNAQLIVKTVKIYAMPF